jgi:hypothetical protein
MKQRKQGWQKNKRRKEAKRDREQRSVRNITQKEGRKERQIEEK